MTFVSKASRRSGRILKTVLFLGAFICSALTLFWMLLLPSYVKLDIESRTGFSVQIDSLAANPFTMKVQARGVSLLNPVQFETGRFLEIVSTSLILDYPGSTDSGWKIIDADIEAKSLTIIVNENGSSNVGLFEKGLFPIEQSDAKSPRFDRLSIEVGVLEVIDYSKPYPITERVKLGKRFQFEYLPSFSHALPEIFYEARLRGYSLP